MQELRDEKRKKEPEAARKMILASLELAGKVDAA